MATNVMKKVHRKFLTIGKYLKEKREAANLSQGDVRDLLGYKSPQLISDWERGVCGPPRDTLPTLVKAYNIKASEFVDLVLKAERVELLSDLGLRKTL